MGTGKYIGYTPVCLVLLLVSSKVRLNRFLCHHRLYPSVASNTSCNCFCKPQKLAFCSSPEITWHCLVLFVTSLFSMGRNEERVSVYLNVKTQVQMSRPFHITGCFEFCAQLVQATMLGEPLGYSRHNKPRLQENGVILMPYNHRLNHIAKEIALKIP